MSNEALFFLATFVNLVFILFAWRMGKTWLYLAIAMNLILTSLLGPKLVTLFGFVVSVTNITYPAIFIGTDILTEHHGKKAGYKSIWLGFFGLIIMIVISQFAINYQSAEFTAEISDSMSQVFGAIPRIMLASFTAYMIAQHFDVWFYHFIHRKTNGKHLWLRNNLSTFVSQFIDSCIFFTLAFYGTVPNAQLIEILLLGFLTKVLFATLDTPCIYLSYWIKGKKLSEAKAVVKD